MFFQHKFWKKIPPQQKQGKKGMLSISFLSKTPFEKKTTRIQKIYFMSKYELIVKLFICLVFFYLPIPSHKYLEKVTN